MSFIAANQCANRKIPVFPEYLITCGLSRDEYVGSERCEDTCPKFAPLKLKGEKKCQ